MKRITARFSEILRNNSQLSKAESEKIAEYLETGLLKELKEEEAIVIGNTQWVTGRIVLRLDIQKGRKGKWRLRGKKGKFRTSSKKVVRVKVSPKCSKFINNV